MRIAKNLDVRLSNWEKNAPIKWSVAVAGLATLFNSSIPIIANIRMMNENLKHDLTTVFFPTIVQFLLFIGVFMAKSNDNGG